MNGKFIVIEGLDGSGKTTLIKRLYDELTTLGMHVVTTRSIGGTVFGQELRDIVLDNNLGGLVSKECRALLFASAMRDMMDKIVTPSTMAGKWVLCDRYKHSTAIYQQGAEELDTLLQIGTRNVVPDLTVYLDIDFETSQRRLSLREDLNHFDTAKADVFNARRAHMKQLIEQHQETEAFMVIDATQDADAVCQQVMDYLRVLFEDSNNSQ